jgi:dihydrofolate reductase
LQPPKHNRSLDFVFCAKEELVRKIRYSVVMSLDGYIAGPNGEADWIIANPEMDFAALFGQFDTLLIGRKTYEFMVKMGQSSVPGMKIFVFSRTMRAANFPGVQVVAESVDKRVKALRGEEGKDIWVFGGGELFRGLLEARLVDTVEVGVIPVLLGGGIPLLPAPAKRTKLKLAGHEIYKAGVVSLTYEVMREKNETHARG